MNENTSSNNVNLSEVSDKGKPFLKGGTYTIRCLKAESRKSKKGDKMLQYDYEICAPETVVDNETQESVKIAGLQLSDFIMLEGKGKDMGLAKLKALHVALKLPMNVNLDAPNTLQYVGRAVKATLSTQMDTLKDQNTGEVIVNEVDGNPLQTCNYKVGRFVGEDLAHTIPQDSVV